MPSRKLTRTNLLSHETVLSTRKIEIVKPSERKDREKNMKFIFISLLLSLAEADDDIEVNMTPGGLPGIHKK